MPLRTPLMAGNWKMHKTTSEAEALAAEIVRAVPHEGIEVIIAPPYTALSAVRRVVAGSAVKLGAQNLYPAEEGAFTGEISARMLADVGVSYVILGHSERRHILGESDQFIQQKVSAAQKGGLIPILCVGETLDQRQVNEAKNVIAGQLERGLSGFKLADDQSLVIAYEPVWAIGTGHTATPDQAQEVHAFIRFWLKDRFDEGLANSMRILYGGSVNADNAAALLGQLDIDGALVGGASLKAKSFKKIVDAGL